MGMVATTAVVAASLRVLALYKDGGGDGCDWLAHCLIGLVIAVICAGRTACGISGSAGGADEADCARVRCHTRRTVRTVNEEAGRAAAAAVWNSAAVDGGRRG